MQRQGETVWLYTGGWRTVRQSGVGQALLHQRQMLQQAGGTSCDRPEPDARVVHINTVLPDSLLAAMYARLTGRKIIWYGHSTMEDFKHSFPGSDQVAPLFKRWICFCYNRADLVITPTPYAKSILEGYGLHRPVVALSNGVDTKLFAENPAAGAAFRQRYGLSKQEKVVVSAGHFIPRKGILDFIETARRMPQVRFFWFGHTDPKLVPQQVAWQMKHVPENLCFAGFVPSDQLRDAYCGADAFYFPSYEETEGIVVLEALACKIPVLVRKIPVYGGWLEDGKNAWLAENAQQFEQKLTGILDGTLPDVTEAGRRTACERDLTRIGMALRGLYREYKMTGCLTKTKKKKPAFLQSQG